MSLKRVKKFVYPSTLYLPPLLTLNTPFLFYLSTPLALSELFLQPSLFRSSEMLLSMTEVDETDSSLLVLIQKKKKILSRIICVTSFFVQNTTRPLIIAVSIVVKRKLLNETVNYDTEIKTYQFEPEVKVIKEGNPKVKKHV